MLNKSYASAAILSLLIPVSSFAADPDRVDATDTLPDAKPGECYSKVIVPAVFEVVTEEVMVKPESSTVEIIPATFDVQEKEVLVKEASTKLVAVPASYRTVTEEIETAPARTEWVTNLGRRGIPASPALLAAAKTNGVDLDSAQPEQCFSEHYLPAKFVTNEKEVLVKEEAEEINIAAAQFEQAEETVMVKASATNKVLVKAEYEVIEEQVMIEPAKAVWKKGTGPITRIDNSTGDIMCLVQIPAKYKTIKKTVLKSPSIVEEVEVPAESEIVPVSRLVSDSAADRVTLPAQFDTVKVTTKEADAAFIWRNADVAGDGTPTGNTICLKAIPAKFTSVKKQVVEAPATIKEEPVPAVYKTVKVQTVSSDAEERRTVIPAVFDMIETRVKKSSERLEWQRVLCETNMTRDTNRRIQQVLKDSGYYNGPIDGSIGRGTLSSVESYQKDNDLPTGGLTIQMLEKMGIM